MHAESLSECQLLKTRICRMSMMWKETQWSLAMGVWIMQMSGVRDEGKG